MYLPLLVSNGVTGIRDIGSALPMAAIEDVRAAITSGERVGPRIVAGMMVDGPTPVRLFASRAATAEEGRQVITATVEAGAGFAKVCPLLPQ